MVRKLTLNVLAVACIGVLCGCKADFMVDLYSSDAFVEENVDTPAIMKVEIPTCSDRKEHESKILSLFEKNSKAKITGCEEQGMTSLMVVSVSAEIATNTSSRDLMIFRAVSENDIEINNINYEVVGIRPALSPNFLSRVNSLMEENFQTLDYNNIKFEVVLNNDEREDILLSATQLWVDGDPYESYKRKPLSRRQKVTLTFPNITSDLVLKGKMPVVAWIGRKK
tara:strand:- start:142 stop:816 length:675 start_codon:yes stop_codon:yes gene_type:complete